MAKSYLDYRGALLPRWQWLRIGAHSRDLAGPDFTTVFRGHLTLTDHPASVEAMAWVLQNTVIPGAVISHTTAALLLGLPLPLQLENRLALLRDGDPGRRRGRPLPAVPAAASLRTGASLPLIHCRVPSTANVTRMRGVSVHRWEPGPTMERGKLTLSSPAEVLRELATVLPPWDLIAVADAIFSGRTESPRIDRAALEEHLASVRGRWGTARLGSVLGSVRERAWSPGESILRLLVIGAGFPDPELNLPVHERRSGRTRYLDLAWPHAGCVLEYDGDGHRTTKEQWRDDEQRRDEIAALGWTIIRANGADLWRPRRILMRLADQLGSRGLGVPDSARIGGYLNALAEKRPSWRVAPRPA